MKTRWTLYQRFARKGWLAMRANVEEDDVKPPAPDEYALESQWVRNDLAATQLHVAAILERMGKLRDDLRGPLTPAGLKRTLELIAETQGELRAELSAAESVLAVEIPQTLDELEQFVEELSQWV